MNLFLALALCFVPLLIGITLCFVFIKDFKIIYALQALIFGIFAVGLIILVRTLINDISAHSPFMLSGYLGLLVSVTLFAFVEEFVKMVLIFFFPIKVVSLRLFVFTCLIFGCTVGSFETLMYLVSGFGDTLLRLFTAVVVHTMCALLSGYFVWGLKHKFSFIRAFGMSFLLHGVYNFFATQNSFIWWFSIITILFMFFKCRIYYSSLKEKSDTPVVPS